MLWSEAFGRLTAWVGIAANTLVFGLYVPGIGVYLSILSVLPFLFAWYLMIAWRLWALADAPAVKAHANGISVPPLDP